MLTWFTDNWEGVLTATGAVVVAASAIANLTPNQTDDKLVSFVSKLVNFLALNWKKPAA